MDRIQFKTQNQISPDKPVINNLGIPYRHVVALNTIRLVRSTPSVFKNTLKRDPIYKDKDLQADILKKVKIGWTFAASGMKFAATTAIIFSILFVSANYSAYYKRFLYWKDSIQAVDAVDPEVELLEKLVDSDETDTETNPTQVMLTSEQVKSVEETLNKNEVIDFDSFAVNPDDYRIVIPKLKINAPVHSTDAKYLVNQDWDGLEKAIQHDLQNGLVHYPGTSLPRYIGNVFITGHSSYYFWDPGKYKDIFANLDQLYIGDEITVYYAGEKTVYRVTDMKVVKPHETNVLNQPDDRSILTLMTCNPVGTNTNRLIVVAEQIYPSPSLNQPYKNIKNAIKIKGNLGA